VCVCVRACACVNVCEYVCVCVHFKRYKVRAFVKGLPPCVCLVKNNAACTRKTYDYHPAAPES
jgi:hypothetical protein